MDSIYFFWLLLHNHFQRGITTYVIFQQLFLNKGNVVVKLNGLFKNKFPNYIYYVLPVITYYTITIITYLVHNKNLKYILFSNDSTCVFQLRIFVLKSDFPNLHTHIGYTNLVFGYQPAWNQPKNEFIRQIVQGFSSCFRILLTLLMNFQTFFVLLCEKSSITAKNEEKLYSICLGLISPRCFQNPKPWLHTQCFTNLLIDSFH